MNELKKRIKIVENKEREEGIGIGWIVKIKMKERKKIRIKCSLKKMLGVNLEKEFVKMEGKKIEEGWKKGVKKGKREGKRLKIVIEEKKRRINEDLRNEERKEVEMEGIGREEKGNVENGDII